MAYSPLAIANAFLARAMEEGVPITNMKLQKLLYFAQGHSLALRSKRLMDEFPEAWEYGPVYPTLWKEFRTAGASPIKRLAVGNEGAFWFLDEDKKPDPIPAPESEEVNKFLDAVWNAYKGKTAIQLSEMSHVPNGPWAKARDEKPNSNCAKIDGESIKSYFSSATNKRKA